MYQFKLEDDDFDFNDDVGFEKDAFELDDSSELEHPDILVDDDFGYDLELEPDPIPISEIMRIHEPELEQELELYPGQQTGSELDVYDSELDLDFNATDNDESLDLPDVVDQDLDNLIVSDDEFMHTHRSIVGSLALEPELDAASTLSARHTLTEWEPGNEELDIDIDLDDDLYSELGDDDKGPAISEDPRTENRDFVMGVGHGMESGQNDIMSCGEEEQVKNRRFERYVEEHKNPQNEEEDEPSQSEPYSDEEEIESNESPAIQCIENMIISFLTQLAFPNGDAKSLNHEAQSQGHSSEEDFNPGIEVVESQPTGKTQKKAPKNKPKIELHLVDRTKEETEDGTLPTKCLRFPKRVKTGSARPFAQLFRVLDLAHEAALSGIPTTKRDIYYKDVKLFKSQKVVDTLVDDLAATFNLERSDLNIRSSSKGLMCGSGLSITLLSGETIQCNDSEGALIPAGEDIATFSVDDDVNWVLVVEKEAVFQTLCKLKICRRDSFPGPGILITGKGYPDVATRHVVKSLADALPRNIPVMGLVDGDPFGLDILSVYKYGSRSMQHENDRLATRRIKWLGIWTSELERYNVDKDCLLPITKHDERKAFSMLRQDKANKKPIPKRWKKELQYMLHSRHKAEIEALCGEQTHLDASSSRVLGTRTVLLSYLTSKISYFVSSARVRENGIE